MTSSSRSKLLSSFSKLEIEMERRQQRKKEDNRMHEEDEVNFPSKLMLLSLTVLNFHSRLIIKDKLACKER